jgi:hypothetical protein
MGFLNFRKKSKKALAKAALVQSESANLQYDNDSGVYSACQSTIEDYSLITGSSVSGLTQSTFSDDIFEEPLPQKSNIICNSLPSSMYMILVYVPDLSDYFNIESETSLYNGIHNSLSLKSSKSSFSRSAIEPTTNLPLPGETWPREHQSHCGIKSQKPTLADNTDNDLLSNSTVVLPASMPSKPTVSTIFQLRSFSHNRESINLKDYEISAQSKADDPTPITSHSVAENYIQSNDDTGTHSGNSIVQNRTAPDDLSNTSAQLQKLTFNKNSKIVPMASASAPSLKNPPDLAMDRMKERHRKECRRPVHWTPATGEFQSAHSRRLNSFCSNNNDVVKALSLQRQQQYNHNQPTTVPSLIIDNTPYNNIIPGQSMPATSTRSKIQVYAPSSISSRKRNQLITLNPISKGNHFGDPVATSHLKSIETESNLCTQSRRSYLEQPDSTALDTKPDCHSNSNTNSSCVCPSQTGYVTQEHSHCGHDASIACKQRSTKLANQHTTCPAGISNYCSVTHASNPLHNQKESLKLKPNCRHETESCERRFAQSSKLTDPYIVHSWEELGGCVNSSCPSAETEKPTPETMCKKPITQLCSHYRSHQSMIKRSYCQSRSYCNHSNLKYKHCCCCRCHSDYCNAKNHLQSKTPSQTYVPASYKRSPNMHSCKARGSKVF